MELNALNVSMQMGNTLKVLRRYMSKAMSEKIPGMTMEEYITLQVLHEEGDCIQNELAQIMGKDKSAVLRQIDELEKKSFLVRIPDLVDRRRKTLRLTPLGEQTRQELLQIRADVFGPFFQELTDEEWKTFSKVLKVIEEKVKG